MEFPASMAESARPEPRSEAEELAPRPPARDRAFVALTWCAAIIGNVEADLANRFSYHAPKGDQPQRYVELRGAAHALAQMVVNLCPDSRERSLALTKLEEAVMWANASIARNE